MSERETCARCGRVGRMFGHASIGGTTLHYCHDTATPPSCYMLSQWDRWPEFRQEGR